MSERGSSSAILLIAWLVLIGFLGYCFDLALAYVYREQLQTALEAAVTAGAMQAEYRLTVRLERRLWRAEANCITIPVPNGESVRYEPFCETPSWVTLDHAPAYASGWEETVWWLHQWAPQGQAPQPLWEAFPDDCGRRPSGEPQAAGEVAVVCVAAVVAACGIYERAPGAAEAAAWRAYAWNRARWGGVLLDRPGRPAILAEGDRFAVGMTAEAEMETRFLRLFGFERLRIAPRSLDGDLFTARLVRGAEVPPGCPH